MKLNNQNVHTENRLNWDKKVKIIDFKNLFKGIYEVKFVPEVSSIFFMLKFEQVQ